MVAAAHRIGLLISAETWRGSGADYQHIAAALREAGHEPHLLTSSPELTARYAAAGLPVSELPIRDTGLGIAVQLRRTLARLGTELLMVDRPRDVRLGALALPGTRLRLVYRYNRHHGRPPCDVLVRLAYRGAVRETVFLTEAGRREVMDQLPFVRRAPTRVVPNGVDSCRFRPDADAGAAYRARHGVGDRPLVVSAASLTAEKRHDVVVHAVAGLPHPRPALHLCGAGPLEGELRALAGVLRVDATFRGLVPHAELVAAYNAATVYAHAAAGEGFGNSVVEAMACGRPVVGVAAAALPETVGTDGCAGVLVSPDDPEAMGRAIAELLADPARRERLGRAARARALGLFSFDAMGAAYDVMVRDVLARP